ncbi:pentapeptide repeat-containing protein [Marinifilum sp. RC60d5]|uniref:pentapeptide repeat-containing protein n=1 Tax=Marinifilum sp. RC60d5 TaxID=3458414 RepID=UPI004037329A
MNSDNLQEQIKRKRIENTDISKHDLDGYDLSKCVIKNVVFATEDQNDRKLCNINFKDSTLENVSFDGATLENCSFDLSENLGVDNISKVSFRKSMLINCRFRKARIVWSDFRYSEINQVTFEEASIDFCDFYRAFFLGVGIFRKSLIQNSSFYYTYFNEGACIRKENLVNGKILQQNKSNYEKFLFEWNSCGTGVRKNNLKNSTSDWSGQESLSNRFSDAEDIYKNLNGLWMSKGFLGDANWAYVQGKRMERNRLFFCESKDSKKPIYFRFKKIVESAFNLLLDGLFGYGESIRKMITTYIIVIVAFAYIYYALPFISISSYIDAIGFSFKNMVAMTPDEIKSINPLIDILNVIQTTIGILLTGIFGFILGNKIRNQ